MRKWENEEWGMRNEKMREWQMREWGNELGKKLVEINNEKTQL